MRLSLCLNSSRALFCDFYKMTHESLFAKPSKTPKKDIWCFTHNFGPLRWKNVRQVFFESRQWYASIAHFTFLKSNFLLFFISNKVTHEPQLKNPSKVPFVLPPYLLVEKGLRCNITLLNNTEVRAFES